jgi:hypothetical protein
MLPELRSCGDERIGFGPFIVGNKMQDDSFQGSLPDPATRFAGYRTKIHVLFFFFCYVHFFQTARPYVQ